MLRLAAIAVDLRGQITPHEKARAPSLVAVLDACDALFEELGWGRPAASPPDADRPDCHLQRRAAPRAAHGGRGAPFPE